MNFSVMQPGPGTRPAWRPPGGAYDIHQFVWKTFDDPDLKTRNFLYRLDADPKPTLYVVSDRPMVNVPDGWRLRTTPYAPQPEAEEVLAFRLRANATVNRSQANGTRAAGRHSVVADALRDNPASWQDAMRDAYRAWFERKGTLHGFEVVERFEVADHRQVTTRAKRAERKLQFDQGDLHGLIRVTDPVKFRDALLQGIGRSRAFGCGLMMVRRP